MYYLSQSLAFESDKIYFTGSDGLIQEVMMDWEHDIMKASTDYVAQNGGDILEIGFGMGISAGYIQSHSISSHTIVENHPDIISKAQEWAIGKPNVKIVTGSWYDVLDDLTKYDGIFYDTYGDEHIQYFESSLPQLTKDPSVATWWNILPNSESIFNFNNIQFQEFNINPPENYYFNSSKYYLPKKQF